jgi:argininosuccinate synthase
VTFTAGRRPEEELSGVPEKARATGAIDCVVRDVAGEFVRDFVSMIAARSTGLLPVAPPAPVSPSTGAEVARVMGCDAVGPRRDRQGNDQVHC